MNKFITGLIFIGAGMSAPLIVEYWRHGLRWVAAAWFICAFVAGCVGFWRMEKL